MMGTARQGAIPTVSDSLDRVVDAAQHVVGNQIELLRLDTTSAMTSALGSAGLVLGGIALLVIGWVVLLMAAYGVMEPSTGSLAALAILAGANLLGGLALLAGARSSGKGVAHG